MKRLHSLRTRLLVGAVVLALVILALRVCVPIYRQRALIEKLEGMGAAVGTRPCGPEWLRDCLGEDAMSGVDHVISVDASHSELNPSLVFHIGDLPRLEELSLAYHEIDDTGLQALRGLRALRVLDLQGTLITDGGLHALQSLSNLESLNLAETGITDQGLEHLGELKRLRHLSLAGTRIQGPALLALASLPHLDELELGDTPVMNTLSQALDDGKVDTTAKIIARHPLLLRARDGYGQTPLHIAVQTDHAAVARLLLQRGADVNAADDFTPLHLAKTPEMVGLLVAFKADLEAGSFRGTPLEFVASECGRPSPVVERASRSVAQALLDAGAEYTLPAAVDLDDVERVREMLKSNPALGRDIDFVWRAVQDGRGAVVKLLIDEFGARPDTVMRDGVPLLCYAIGSPAVLDALLTAGANPRMRLKAAVGIAEGSSPLHLAVQNDNLQSAECLLAHGAEVDARDAAGQTPLHWAANAKRLAMVRLLLKAGADANARDGRRRTPLDLATDRRAGKSDPELVKALTGAGGR